MFTRKFKTRIWDPEVLLTTGYIIFLISAFISYLIPVTKKYLLNSFGGAPSITSYLLSVLGILIFLMAVPAGRKIEIRDGRIILLLIFPVTTAVLYLTLPLPLVVALLGGVGYSFGLFLLSRQHDLQRLTMIAFLLTILSAASILMKGIPILSAEARAATAVSTSRALFHGFGVFTGALLMGFYNPRKAGLLVALLAGVGIISGFKSDAIAIILSASLTGLILGKISFRAGAIALGGIFGILTLASTFIALVAHGSWNIPPLFYPFYRFGFTFGVFSKVVEVSIPFGFLHGKAILDTTQKILSTSVLGYTEPHIITSSLFGPLTLDFGIPGLLFTAFFIGIYLGLMRKDSIIRVCLYSMALTHVLVLIEVGLQLTSVMFLLSMLFLSVTLSDGGGN